MGQNWFKALQNFSDYQDFEPVHNNNEGNSAEVGDLSNYQDDDPEQNYSGEFHYAEYGNQPFRYVEYGVFDPANDGQNDDEYWPSNDCCPNEEDSSSSSNMVHAATSRTSQVVSSKINFAHLVKPISNVQVEDGRFLDMSKQIVKNFFEKYNVLSNSKDRCKCQKCMNQTLNLAVALAYDPEFSQPAFESGDSARASMSQQVVRPQLPNKTRTPEKATKRILNMKRIDSEGNNILEEGESSAKRHRTHRAEDEDDDADDGDDAADDDDDDEDDDEENDDDDDDDDDEEDDEEYTESESSSTSDQDQEEYPDEDDPTFKMTT